MAVTFPDSSTAATSGLSLSHVTFLFIAFAGDTVAVSCCCLPTNNVISFGDMATPFPIGFLIMQRWLEQYVKQTNIPAWIYLSIVFVLALVIVLCVGWQVYRTSVENPADVVKSE